MDLMVRVPGSGPAIGLGRVRGGDNRLTRHPKEMVVVKIDRLQGSVPFLTSDFTFVISLRAMLGLGYEEGAKSKKFSQYKW